jgi:hypothetical protein
MKLHCLWKKSSHLERETINERLQERKVLKERMMDSAIPVRLEGA